MKMQTDLESEFFYGRLLMEGIQHTVTTKQGLISSYTIRYLMRAMMAGFIISLITIFTWKLKLDFLKVSDPGIASLIGGLGFSVALVFIMFTYSELLTSNFMYFTVGMYYKTIDLYHALLVFLVCFIGNILGELVLFIMLSFSTLLSDDMIKLMITITEYKTHTLSAHDIFIRGIFANFFINISIIVSMHFKESFPKMFVLMIGVTIFAYMGYEHVIANGIIFTGAIVNGLSSEYYLDIIKNIIMSGLGNYIGGGLFIGLFYAYLNAPKSSE